MFKGVGPKIAARIVAALGPKAVEMFDSGDFEVWTRLVCTYIPHGVFLTGYALCGGTFPGKNKRVQCCGKLPSCCGFVLRCVHPASAWCERRAGPCRGGRSKPLGSGQGPPVRKRVAGPLSCGSYLSRPRPRPSTSPSFVAVVAAVCCCLLLFAAVCCRLLLLAAVCYCGGSLYRPHLINKNGSQPSTMLVRDHPGCMGSLVHFLHQAARGKLCRCLLVLICFRSF